MIERSALITKIDIPFPEAKLIMHQPSYKQIAYIGEENFLIGCQFLTFSKSMLKNKDKKDLEKFSDFQILMKIIQEDNIEVQKKKVCMELVLLLLFPQCSIAFSPISIIISLKDAQGNIQHHLIDKGNFDSFKEKVQQIFCVKSFLQQSMHQYNPGGPQAAALVQKFKKRHQKLAKMKQQSDKKSFSIFEQYILVLAVGEQKDINSLTQYSLYQLLREFRRFKVKYNFDLYFDARLAGAQNLEDVQNWTNPENQDSNIF